MKKILVADDNSNVHKTVALALGELGVDVLAVNNGEAAVRKIPEVLPDLVLADIFMPVRNGYEVCEFVKKEIHLQHIPVVLLVGAFDPLDEREAQRVGADGILKKPFVPPDPLITMVRTLLERVASQRPVEVAVSRAPASKTPVPVAVQAKSVADASHDSPAAHEEYPPIELPAPAAPVTFGEGERPIAFGSLLGSSMPDPGHAHANVMEPVDNEQVLTSQRDASLGEPIFWRNDPPPAPAEGEEGQGNAEEQQFNSWASQPPPVDHEQAASSAESDQPLELVIEEPDATASSQVESAHLSIDPAANAALTVDTSDSPDLILSTQEWMDATAHQPPPAEATETPEPSMPPVTPDAPPLASSSHEPAPGKMASNARENQVATGKAPPQPAPPSAIPEPPKPLPKWADLSGVLGSSPLERHPAPAAPMPPRPSPPSPPAATTAPAPPPPPAATPSPTEAGTLDPAVVEAVVERVLDKMRPQVVDIITKEFLRPVVQALVAREIEKK